MALRLLSFMGIVLMGYSPLSSADLRELTERQELARLMNQSGIRKNVDLNLRKDLAALPVETLGRTQELRVECEWDSLAEIRIIQNDAEWIAGYEATVFCPESPSPAVMFYYNVNHTFLDVFSPMD